MVANISHELRTPITAIRLLVETLQRGAVKSPAKAEPLLEKIAAETDTLQQMAQELLDLAMIESGRAEIRLVPGSLREIVEDATSHLEEMASRGNVLLRNEVDPAINVLADTEQVARVITNLVHNALKFTPPGGEVVIGSSAEGDTVTVMVSDTGPGIARTERDRVFERFYRGDRARQSAGTGLGLAIVKHIIEAHGGRAWAAEPPRGADSSRPGARLCFTLPAAAPLQEQ
jgi:two-component system phosphate regulon sensor histidine kinase PhoR